MTDQIRRRIIEHISDRRYHPTGAEELAEQLGIGPDELEEFTRVVTALVDQGQAVLSNSQDIALPPVGREMIGVIRLAARGFAFISPDSPVEHGDLFVPAHHVGGALTGDRVRAKVIFDPRRGAEPGRSPHIGQVVEILQRAQNKFVGNLRKIGSHWEVEVDGHMLKEPVVIRDPHAKSARAGDKVVVELLEYAKNDKPAQGVITEVLGEQGQPDVETLATMRAFGLPDRFPEAVLKDARDAALGFHDTIVPAERLDLTGQFILTIDPPDARDFDDAISIRRLDGRAPDGQPPSPFPHWNIAGAVWELGVHIAHVSHFVQKGMAIDEEAYKRGNSSYLPRKVVPMLPEVLSNGVCSLQEGVNRFCLSAFMLYDADGKVLDQRFARSVIRSSKRLTYLEAQALIDDNLREAVKHARTEPKYPRKVTETLKLMNELAGVIRGRRLGEGMVVLGLPQVELVFDDSGRVTDAVPEDSSFTHTIIEMFMVEANEAAARVFSSLNVPMIRRIHPDPPALDMTELRQFAKIAGYTIPSTPTRHDLQGLLDASRGTPAQAAVHLAVLKTLARAEYSPELIGHFALASADYTHFTSPIRRYPDLIVHRGLDAYLDAVADPSIGRHGSGKLSRRLSDDPRVPPEESLIKLGKHCSMTERNSAAAESDLRTYLVLDLLREHLGEDYEGTVTGVTGDGVYVQLDKYLVDGFIRSTDLPGQPSDRWRINRQSGALVAMRSGMSIRIGDRYTVRIANVNPVRRQLEMVIVSKVGKPAKERRDAMPQGARKTRLEAQRIKRDRRDQKKFKKRRR